MTDETIKFKVREGSDRASIITRYIEANVDDVMPDELNEGESMSTYEVTVTVKEIIKVPSNQV